MITINNLLFFLCIFQFCTLSAHFFFFFYFCLSQVWSQSLTFLSVLSVLPLTHSHQRNKCPCLKNLCLSLSKLQSLFLYWGFWCLTTNDWCLSRRSELKQPFLILSKHLMCWMHITGCLWDDLWLDFWFCSFFVFFYILSSTVSGTAI